LSAVFASGKLGLVDEELDALGEAEVQMFVLPALRDPPPPPPPPRSVLQEGELGAFVSGDDFHGGMGFEEGILSDGNCYKLWRL